MVTQPVVIDREKTSEDVINRSANAITPPSIAQGWFVEHLGLGIIHYWTNIDTTGSAQTTAMPPIARPHYLLRVEYQQLVKSSGAADATGIAVALKKLNRIFSSGTVNPNAFLTIYNQANTANDTVIFATVGGLAQGQNTLYQHAFTGQNNDTLTMDIYIQLI